VPKQQAYYEPDSIDCNTLVQAIGEDFGCVCAIDTVYELDQVRTTVRVYRLGERAAGVVQVQAVVKAPLKARKSLYTMQYSALLDCWHPLDRGVLAVAQKPMEREWNGRPKAPRR
jgi:hypothetical protein